MTWIISLPLPKVPQSPSSRLQNQSLARESQVLHHIWCSEQLPLSHWTYSGFTEIHTFARWTRAGCCMSPYSTSSALCSKDYIGRYRPSTSVDFCVCSVATSTSASSTGWEMLISPSTIQICLWITWAWPWQPTLGVFSKCRQISEFSPHISRSSSLATLRVEKTSIEQLTDAGSTPAKKIVWNKDQE